MHVASDDIPIRLIILLGDDGSPIGRRRTRGDNYLRNPASTQPADKGQDVRPHLVHEIPLKIFLHSSSILVGDCRFDKEVDKLCGRFQRSDGLVPGRCLSKSFKSLQLPARYPRSGQQHTWQSSLLSSGQ